MTTSKDLTIVLDGLRRCFPKQLHATSSIPDPHNQSIDVANLLADFTFQSKQAKIDIL